MKHVWFRIVNDCMFLVLYAKFKIDLYDEVFGW